MGPMMNKALGALGGPQKLNVLGKTHRRAGLASDVTFTSTGGLVTLNTMMLIEGTEKPARASSSPTTACRRMDPGSGMQLGIADDLANEMLAEVAATGLLNLVDAGHRRHVRHHATSR